MFYFSLNHFIILIIMSSCTQLVLNTIDDINKLLPSLDENSTLKIVKVPKSGGKQKGGMNVDDVTLQLCQLTTESKESVL